MIAQRILAVLAAILLVGAVALATLSPPDMPLGQLLFLANHDALQNAEAVIDHYASHWLWSWACVPLLVRPTWLLPAMLGILCAGLSTSLASRGAARNPHHRKRS
ncbi:MAG: hypothetical protein JOZ42_09565 [Acetobacteraceae bacterium]|nr:hypothetical protein [Acetobacteraceae bacterium]